VPLTPFSLARDLLADIGEMALSFAFAEIRVAEVIAIESKADLGCWTKNSLTINLNELSRLRPSLSSEIEKMRADAKSRNSIMHGALQAITGASGFGPMKAQAHNYSFRGHTQPVDAAELKRLSRAAFRFACAVIDSN